jgi:hypothetical protein
VLTQKTLCQYLLSPGGLPPAFRFTHDGRSYQVMPYGHRDGRLSLRIEGDDWSLGRVETVFRFPA